MPTPDPIFVGGVSSAISAVLAYLAGNRTQVSSILKQQDDRITALLEELKNIKDSDSKRIADLERELGEERVLNARLDHRLKTCLSSSDYLRQERDEARAELKKMKEGK